MSASPQATPSAQSPTEQDNAEALRHLVRELEQELLAALDDQTAQSAVDRLQAINHSLEALDQSLQTIDPEVAGALVERLRLGLDRLACDLHQRGGWEHLDAAQRNALLSRHAAGLTRIDGVGKASAERIFLHGISDPERFQRLTPEALDDIEGLNGAVLARLKKALTEARET